MEKGNGKETRYGKEGEKDVRSVEGRKRKGCRDEGRKGLGKGWELRGERW